MFTLQTLLVLKALLKYWRVCLPPLTCEGIGGQKVLHALQILVHVTVKGCLNHELLRQRKWSLSGQKCL